MLLSPGNAPAWAAENALTIEVHAPNSELAGLEASPIFAKFAAFCAVEFHGHAPAPKGFERRAAGLVFEAAVERARAEGASLIALPMNALIADGALLALRDLENPDRSVLFIDPLEVSAAPMLGWLGDGSGDRLVMKSSDLVEAVLRHFPPSVTLSIVDQTGAIESGARRAIFAKPDGLSVRGAHPLPFYFGATALAALGDELNDPPDGYVIDRVLASDAATPVLIADATTFAMAILTDQPGTNRRSDPRAVADSITETLRAMPALHNRVRLLRSATRWSGRPVTTTMISDADEAAMIEAAANGLAAL